MIYDSLYNYKQMKAFVKHQAKENMSMSKKKWMVISL